MSSPIPEVRRVHPLLAGAIAMAGYACFGAALGAVASLLGAPAPVITGSVVVGCVLGYLASRTLLRRLYTPR